MAIPAQTSLPPKFAGEFRHKVEGKGRITIPAKWRFEEEVEMFMVAKTAQRCIAVLTPAEVDRMKEGLSGKSAKERADILDIFGRATRQVTLDKAGRITIPEDFCAQFKISGEVWLSGAIDTFSIWNIADYEGIKAQEETRRAAALHELGL